MIGGVSSFSEMFAFRRGSEEPVDDERYEQPAWFGPPEDELGTCVPLSIVLGRSERAVVALTNITAHSTGLKLELLALARGLRQSETSRVFHEQHIAGPEDDLSDLFLRVGVEFADGRRASNLEGYRHALRPDQEPEGPLLMQSGGGGGSADTGTVSLHPGYWLWPLPPEGPLRVFTEWPGLEIELCQAELEGAAIADAARRSEQLWSD